MRVLVGLSGGVDSAAALSLLKKEYDVSGVTLSLYDEGICKEQNKKNILDAKAICQAAGAEHFVLDLKQEFYKKVIEEFVSEYKNGLTPNPCIFCNKYIKFGEMLNFAKENGYEKIATGHYAKIEENCGKFYLKKAADTKKDQTYVLYNLTQDILSCLLLPLGDFTKEDCRKIAKESGFPVAEKKDSQDICFVPDGNYATFIESMGVKSQKGDYLDKNGNILGKHNGIIHYTIGQRKGLGIALGSPKFVISKNASDNTVVLGESEDLFSKYVNVGGINFITDEINDGEKISAKLRYSAKESEAIFHKTKDGATLEFTTSQRAVTKGQSAVFYREDYCLGGGIILGG